MKLETLIGQLKDNPLIFTIESEDTFLLLRRFLVPHTDIGILSNRFNGGNTNEEFNYSFMRHQVGFQRCFIRIYTVGSLVNSAFTSSQKYYKDMFPGSEYLTEEETKEWIYSFPPEITL